MKSLKSLKGLSSLSNLSSFKSFKSFKFKSLALICCVVMIVTAFTACGGGADGERVIRVGGKDFTEQLILAQIAIVALENAGIPIDTTPTHLGGTDVTRSAMLDGAFDLYWEYTGTAWMMFLGYDHIIQDTTEMFNRIRDWDYANDVIWFPYAPLNNTYVVMMPRARAEELELRTLTDLADYLRVNPGTLVFGGDHEFTVRPDGLPGLMQHYGFNFEGRDVMVMDMGVVFMALGDGQIDLGMGFATDGRILALDLVVLEDNLDYFPSYNVTVNMRRDALEAYPEIETTLRPIIARLTDAVMMQLNALVDIYDYTPREVAEDWLKGEGLI